MYGDFSAKNTVCTPYIREQNWFWPTLIIYVGAANPEADISISNILSLSDTQPF
jgi:hypothetical protein